MTLQKPGLPTPRTTEGDHAKWPNHPPQVVRGADGRLHVGLKELRRVGICNLTEVKTHTITTILNSTSHFIRFHGGGELSFAYTQHGQLLSLHWDNLAITFMSDNEVVFSRCTDPEPPMQLLTALLRIGLGWLGKLGASDRRRIQITEMISFLNDRIDAADESDSTMGMVRALICVNCSRMHPGLGAHCSSPPREQLTHCRLLVGSSI